MNNHQAKPDHAMSPRSRTQRGIVAISAVAVLAMLPACGVFGGNHTIIEGRPYPGDKVQAAVLDIQVVRDGVEVTLTNTSGVAFGPGTLWLNQEFAYEIDGFAIGETRTLDLRDFTNRFGESFRAGGFFASRSPKRVVHVQMEAQGSPTLLGFLVVPESAS